MTRPTGTDVPPFRPESGAPSISQPEVQAANKLDEFLTSPFAGTAPWALMSILAGMGRFEIAVGAALGFSLLVIIASSLRGFKIHMLEVFGVVVFAALAIVGLFASDGLTQWLQMWLGELVNISLAAFVWATLLVRRPFTMSYAKLTTPREYWDTPLFKRINDVVTTVWGVAFTFAAAVGFVGDFFLHSNDNFWTGWILQLVGIFFAVAFSEFYPDYASAKFDLANGEPAEKPSPVQLVEWAPTFATVTGIAGLVTGAIGFGLATLLIIAGSVLSGMMAKLSPERADV